MTQFNTPNGWACYGYCQRCMAFHGLPTGRAKMYATKMMDAFRTEQRLDYWVPRSQANDALSFERLFPGDNGHMFGVMEAADNRGETHWIRAFSSLHGGLRHVDGWANPIPTREFVDNTWAPGEAAIKAVTADLCALTKGSAAYNDAVMKRRRMSQILAQRIKDAYVLTNFRGESGPIEAVYHADRKMPGGVGDCCAPKLIHHAIQHGLTPISMAEFFWGPESTLATKRSGEFYPSCEARCLPILGFMLCGLETHQENHRAGKAPC